MDTKAVNKEVYKADYHKGSKRVPISDDALNAVSIDREITIGDGLTIRIDRYESSGTFRHAPVGGFSSALLSAKEGYLLLCLYMSVEDNTGAGVDTSALQQMVLHADGFSAIEARCSFFQMKQEGQRIKPFQKKTRSITEGYLLFVLPKDVLDSGVQLTATLYYGDNAYSFRLVPEEMEGEGP